MGVGSASGKGVIRLEVNVVPLIDILLVLLVIFMIIPHQQMGLEASLPQTVSGPVPEYNSMNCAAVWNESSLSALIALLFFKETVPSSFRRLPRF